MKKSMIPAILFALAVLIATAGCQSAGGGKSLFGGPSLETRPLVTDSGYRTEAWVYSAGDKPTPVTVVFVHGKRGNPGVRYAQNFISKMNAAGHTVIAPVMPWSQKRGYEGSRQDGLDVIAKAVDMAAPGPVVVVGQSMGAMAVLQYGAAPVSPRVAGLVAVSFGHDPNHSGKMRRRFGDAAAQACADHNSGHGARKRDYPERNQKETYTINASAEYYCTYYSVDQYPDSHEIAQFVSKPMLIVAGTRDRLTRVYQPDEIFQTLPANPKHRYLEVNASHKDAIYEHADKIVGWMASL